MEWEKRFRCEALKSRLMSADEAAMLIEDGMTVAVSGFTPSGCPKVVPLALAEQVRSGKRQLRLGLLSGASTGDEIDSAWAPLGMIARRLPYMTSKPLRNAVNGGLGGPVAYTDIHLGQVAQNARYGFYGKIHMAIIEAAAVTEDGNIIPTTAVGCSQTYIDLADQVIVELNLNQPAELEGFHDIYRMQDPPYRKPIPLTEVGQRIGKPWLSCPAEKIAAVVISGAEEKPRPLAPEDEVSRRIAANIVSFLQGEKTAGRLSADKLPLQSGVGSVANAVLLGLKDSDFSHLTFYSEVMQDGIMDLIDAGKADMASATSLSLSKEGMQRLLGNLERYRDKIILRDSEISNSAEVIRRLGVIAMSISIFMTNSVAKGGAISSIVPMVTHVDHTEHDVDVLVTEQGYADLRGLSPKERAIRIIENCAHPTYRPQLRVYYEKACDATHSAQTPHLLEDCFTFHAQLRQAGTMLSSEEEKR